MIHSCDNFCLLDLSVSIWYYLTLIDIREAPMTQVTARLPDELVKQLDEAAQRLKRSRAELIRRAIAYYLDDVEDLRLGFERLNDPADPVLDWDDVKRDLLAAD
jgi:transposase